MRGVVIGVVGVLALIWPASTAAAAPSGGFISYIEDARAGFQSRVWNDPNTDNYDANIMFFFCSSNPEVGVYRYTDDQLVAKEIMWCLNTTDYFYFGDLPAREYYFKIINPRSDNGLLEVARVIVRHSEGPLDPCSGSGCW
jgi:hypothetical protein